MVCIGDEDMYRFLNYLRKIYASIKQKGIPSFHPMSEGTLQKDKIKINQDGNVALRAGVYYRLLMRQSLFGRVNNLVSNLDSKYKTCLLGYRNKHKPRGHNA